MQFEWDKNKNKSNTKKHSITFEEATDAFSDKKSIYLFDRDVNDTCYNSLTSSVMI